MERIREKMRIDRKKAAGYAKLAGKILLELLTVVAVRKLKGMKFWK